jgi:hypothetical protein
MLSFQISLIKISYFVDTTERGDRGVKAEEIGGETEGDFTDNSNELGKFHKITKTCSLNYKKMRSCRTCGLYYILFSWVQRIRTTEIMKF